MKKNIKCHGDTETHGRRIKKFLSVLCDSVSNSVPSPPSTILRVVLFLCLLTALPAFAGSENPDLQKGKKELQDIRKEIRVTKKGLARAGKKEKNLLGEIKKIERRLEELRAEEAGMDREIILLHKGLLEKTASLSALGLEIEKKKKLLYRRLVFLYKTEETGYLRSLLSMEDITESGTRFRYMARIAAHDRDLIKNYGSDLAVISRQMEEIRADKIKVEGAEKQLEAKREEIKREKVERDRLLSAVRKEKLHYKSSLKELEANARDLQKLLKKLEKQASMASRSADSGKASGFELQKGLLDFPVNGEVIGLFGKEMAKDSKTAVYRKGIEIRSKEGSGIRAVYSGRVIFADQFKGYGLMMIIDHGGGYYTLYANAAKLVKKLNDEINKGDIIGEVGEAPSLNGPVLYFEVRKGGKPENPMEWLKS